MSMSEIPKNAKIEAFEAVLDRYDTEDMSAEEMCEVLTENKESINNISRKWGLLMKWNLPIWKKQGIPMIY